MINNAQLQMSFTLYISIEWEICMYLQSQMVKVEFFIIVSLSPRKICKHCIHKKIYMPGIKSRKFELNKKELEKLDFNIR